MLEVVKMIRERKWDSVVTWFLLVILIAVLPTYLDDRIGKQVTTAVDTSVGDDLIPLIEPIVASTEETNRIVSEIQRQIIDDKRDEAIVAFDTKIFTIEDLQPLTQNGLAVRNGLLIPEIRATLFAKDPQRVRIFEEFFFGG